MLIIQADDCPFTGPPVTAATGISPSGRYVVGWHHQCDPAFKEAWVYDTVADKAFTLPRPTGVFSASANDVNDNGLIVGTLNLQESGGFRGFVYDLKANDWTILEPQPKGDYSFANAVNNAGVVCGTRSIGPGAKSIQCFHLVQKERFHRPRRYEWSRQSRYRHF